MKTIKSKAACSILLSTIFVGFYSYASVTELSCVEIESYDSLMMRMNNDEESEFSLQNTKPNAVTDSIGDYTITLDSNSKKIVKIEALRETSNFSKIWTSDSSIFENSLQPLKKNSFDGDCNICRTHFELITATDTNSGESITIRIDDHGTYPDGVASSFSLKTNQFSFESLDQYLTEFSCRETNLLQRPLIEDSLDDELLE